MVKGVGVAGSPYMNKKITDFALAGRGGFGGKGIDELGKLLGHGFVEKKPSWASIPVRGEASLLPDLVGILCGEYGCKKCWLVCSCRDFRVRLIEV